MSSLVRDLLIFQMGQISESGEHFDGVTQEEEETFPCGE